ncbi:MAG TPA: extracellular solute-binding protein [Candidatus Dormibacteraeota bacterium]|nr:extracellular solute-binding protein [Candidatus Dormibacteraeota bacterium]
MTVTRRIVHSLAAVCLAVVAACGHHDGPPVTELRFWAMGREGEVVQALLPAFERAHPGVRVRVQQVPWSAAHEKLLTAFVGGSMPDVFQAGSTWMAELVALGAVRSLDDHLPGGNDADEFPGIAAANRIDGHTWALPWYVDTRLLFYRADLLRAAGWETPPSDWAGWRRALADLKHRAGPDRYALLLPLDDWQTPVILALQGGARLLRGEDEWGDFQSAAFHDAFSFYLDFFKQNLAPAGAQGQVANLYQDFAAGFFSVFITGPWNLGELAARMPADLQSSWATAPMPGTVPGSPGLSIAGGASLAIAADTPHADAAWALVSFLAAAEQQLDFYRLSGDLPARPSAWTAGRLADDPRVAAFWAQLQHVEPPPRIPEWERIAAAISRAAEAAVRGDRSPDEALAELDREVDAILAKRRWLLAQRRAEPRTSSRARDAGEPPALPGGALNAARCM